MLYDPNTGLDEVGRALMSAYNILKERGHAKHALETPDGRVCLVGAVNMATTGRPGPSYFMRPSVEELKLNAKCMDKLEKQSGMYIYGLVAWNNDPERTQDEVLKLFYDVAQTCKVAV